MASFAVIIPAMNEASSIRAVIEDIRALHDCAVIVVDDASTDDTALVSERAGAIVLRHVVNMGAWRATQTGIRFARSQGIERVISMDADGQHLATEINKLLEASLRGTDVVIGSCLSRGSWGRHVTWQLLKWITRLGVSDLTSGLRCYNRNAIDVLCSEQATMFEYQDVGVLLMLRDVGLRCQEIEVLMNERENGISRIFYSWLAVGKYLLYTLVLSTTKAGSVSTKHYKERLKLGENSE
ncbi:glycosyltransferase family 2 protein [Aestuariibacter halophilus]|uniref:Glycosyltransferase family 2 protein n=1 Tax=Fluctibacter halophilus TaxID=226011 RepID=A0ABS8G2K5_9ALTE|nr:glycosyltransferase family 2 protein [Aestuariibacter halophilus]MCC2614817.1 glycosyltransferase family 2 protein [Aestuariibacter halophilus]